MIRGTFYKVVLQLSNDQTMPIIVATNDIQKVGPLVESQKMIYNRKEYHVTGFYIEDTRYPIGMSAEQYDQEIIHTDIVDPAIE